MSRSWTKNDELEKEHVSPAVQVRFISKASCFILPEDDDRSEHREFLLTPGSAHTRFNRGKKPL